MLLNYDFLKVYKLFKFQLVERILKVGACNMFREKIMKLF